MYVTKMDSMKQQIEYSAISAMDEYIKYVNQLQIQDTVEYSFAKVVASLSKNQYELLRRDFKNLNGNTVGITQSH